MSKEFIFDNARVLKQNHLSTTKLFTNKDSSYALNFTLSKVLNDSITIFQISIDDEEGSGNNFLSYDSGINHLFIFPGNGKQIDGNIEELTHDKLFSSCLYLGARENNQKISVPTRLIDVVYEILTCIKNKEMFTISSKDSCIKELIING